MKPLTPTDYRRVRGGILPLLIGAGALLLLSGCTEHEEPHDEPHGGGESGGGGAGTGW